MDRARKLGVQYCAFAGVHGPATMPELSPPAALGRIAVALDFSDSDQRALSYAVSFARGFGKHAAVTLLHVVESGSARLLGGEATDLESRSDEARLELYCAELGELGLEAEYALGFGNPVDELTRMVTASKADLIVLAGHGHRGLEDLLHGATVASLRHRISVPVMVVPPGRHEGQSPVPPAQSG